MHKRCQRVPINSNSTQNNNNLPSTLLLFCVVCACVRALRLVYAANLLLWTNVVENCQTVINWLWLDGWWLCACVCVCVHSMGINVYDIYAKLPMPAAFSTHRVRHCHKKHTRRRLLLCTRHAINVLEITDFVVYIFSGSPVVVSNQKRKRRTKIMFINRCRRQQAAATTRMGLKMKTHNLEFCFGGPFAFIRIWNCRLSRGSDDAI